MAPSTETPTVCFDAAPQQNGYATPKPADIELKEQANPDDDEDMVEVEMIVPPDGGWGWVIVTASFLCNLCVDGIIFSYGIFLNDITKTFGVSKAKVALAGSLQTGFYLMAGPFVSALANRYGFRVVAMSGSVISCCAFILSYFAPSIEYMYFTYGVLGGIGVGMIYVPAVITTGFYFERWRALATGIAVCGSGIGAFILAPLSEFLVQRYGWREAILIQGGMLLSCVAFGAMFREIKPTRVKVKKSQDPTEGDDTNSFLGAATSCNSLHVTQPARNRFFRTNNNTEYPTAAQAAQAGQRRSSHTDIVNTSMHSLHHMPAILIRELSTSEKRLSAPIYPEMAIVDGEEIKTVEEENNLLSGDLERLNGRIPTTRRHTISGRRLGIELENGQNQLRILGKRNSITRDHQRPFYRDDIFYGGSLHRLPHYRSQMSSVGYHMSVTRLPTTTDVEEEESGSCYICPESVRRILTTMLDTSLLKSPSFLLLAISGSLTMMGFYTPFMYLPDRAHKLGLDLSTSMFLVSVIGIGNTVGRVVCGLVTSLPGVDALLLNNIFISIGGIATMCSGLSDAKEYLFFYAALFGLSISVFASLRSIIVVDLMGLEKLTNAFGLLLLFQGVAATLGSPLGGAFVDLTGSYAVSFYLSGALILLSAVILYPLNRINAWEKRKSEETASATLKQ